MPRWGKKPADRVKALLGKLHSISISKKRGSKASKKADLLFNKFIKQVEKIFKNLPKSLEWRSFYINELPILMDISEELQKVSIQPQLSEKCSIGRSLLFAIRYFTRYHLDFDNSIHRDAKIIRLSRLACPPSFWRGWTQEQIAKVVGLGRNRVSEIIGNANFGEIDTSLSQGRDMDYIDLMKRSGWEITHLIDCPLSLRGVSSLRAGGQSALVDAICVAFLAFSCASAKKLSRNSKEFALDIPDIPSGS